MSILLFQTLFLSHRLNPIIHLFYSTPMQKFDGENMASNDIELSYMHFSAMLLYYIISFTSNLRIHGIITYDVQRFKVNSDELYNG